MQTAGLPHAENSDLKAGKLVVIVGASGAGKDTLMDYAREALDGDDRFVFTLRAITRQDMAGEVHVAMTDEEFGQQAKRGNFAVLWQAHGFSYGVPRSAVRQVRSGKTVIVNGSRSALKAFQHAFGAIHVIEITARPDILAARLAKRGRETATEIRERLQHAGEPFDFSGEKTVIENNSTIEAAGDRLVEVLRRIANPN